uniref:Uncharacterized protein n=1 Tax=Arundo donax TaxID=35708 RepID=A0A0A9F4X7_ARUDO
MIGKNGGQFFSSIGTPAFFSASSLLLISASRRFRSDSHDESSLALLFESLMLSSGTSTTASPLPAPPKPTGSVGRNPYCGLPPPPPSPLE